MTRDKTVSTSVGSFHLNGKWYDHQIYCADDDRVECLDEDDNLILIFTSDCHVLDHNKQQVGTFHMVSGQTWIYVDSISTRQYGTDLLKAEIEVAKLYIQGELK